MIFSLFLDSVHESVASSVFVNIAASDESVPDELSLYVGRTFTNFEDFEKLHKIKRRQDALNEILVKGSGNLSVQKANAQLKSSTTLAYRDSLVYAWADFRCTHHGKFKSRGKQRESK